MLNFSRVCFIGSGTMAEAMIKGMLAQRLVVPGAVIASGPRAERGAELASTYGVQVTSDNLAALQGADLVVISVKPQVLPGVLAQISGDLHAEANSALRPEAITDAGSTRRWESMPLIIASAIVPEPMKETRLKFDVTPLPFPLSQGVMNS